MPRKPRDPVDDFASGAVPEGRKPSDVVLRITETQRERMGVCVRAAQMRARHMSFRAIAKDLGMENPKSAYEAVRIGLSLLPDEDMREARRLEVLRLDRIGREAMARVADPGPLVSQGKVMLDPDTGLPYPDNQIRIQALTILLKLSAEVRRFRGLDAPKRSVSLLAEVPVTEIQAHLDSLRAELGLPEGPGMLPSPVVLPGEALAVPGQGTGEAAPEPDAPGEGD